MTMPTRYIFRQENQGQSVTEYGIFFAAVVVVLVLVFRLHGPFYDNLSSLFDRLMLNISVGLVEGK